MPVSLTSPTEIAASTRKKVASTKKGSTIQKLEELLEKKAKTIKPPFPAADEFASATSTKKPKARLDEPTNMVSYVQQLHTARFPKDTRSVVHDESSKRDELISSQQREIAKLRQKLKASQVLQSTELEVARSILGQLPSPTDPLSDVKQRMARFILQSKEVNRRLAQRVAALELQLAGTQN